MKNIRIKIILATAIIGATIGCTKDFRQTNTSPTLVTKDVVKPALLFTAAIKGAVFEIPAQGLIADFSGYYKNPASGNIFLEREWGNPYNVYYRSYLINLSEVIRLTANDSLQKNTNAIARIARAMVFQQLTDAYGDIPYFDAVQTVENVILLPKYDTQEAIYKDLFKELKEAAAQLTNSSSQATIGAADILLKGNVDAWRRFANSLRLRMAMRVRYADPALAKQHIDEVIGQPLITTNAQNVVLATVNDGNTANANQFSIKNSTSPNNMLVSFTLTDNLKRLSDPRLPILARQANSPIAGYRGVPLQYGEDAGTRYATDSVSRMATSFLQPVYNIVVMNAAEVNLLRAEAALAGITTENAQELYAAGIQLAMTQYGVAAGDITTYLASPAATLAGGTEERLEQIIVQKWLAIYYNTHEGWAEFRRTGYPRIWTGSTLGDTQGNIPRRLTYPTDEFLRNGDNVSAAVAKLANGNKLTSKVWWDKKAGVPFAHPRQGMFPPEF